MMQIYIKQSFDSGLTETSVQPTIQINGQDAGLQKTIKGDWTIYCWGDPACSGEDAELTKAIFEGQSPTAWGRSWIAVNSVQSMIKVGTDQLGLFPVWYCHTQTNITLTNDRKAMPMLSHKGSLNAKAMRTLVAFGQLFNDETLWNNIYCLPARSHLKITTDGSLEKQSCTLPVLQNCQTNFSSALDAFVEAVRISFESDEHPMISLSGGLDSRLILAAALALGKKPRGLTYGRKTSGDFQIAKQLAQCAGIPLFASHHSQTPWQWPTFQRVSELGGGEVAMHHAHAVLDDTLLQQTQGHRILTGTGAETTRAFYYDRGMPGYSLMGQPFFRKTLMQKACGYIEQEFMKSAAGFFAYAPHTQTALTSLLHQKIKQHVSSFNHPAHFLDNFYLQHRVPKMVAHGQQILDSHYERSHPFLNKDALFYMAHLPVRYKIASSFHRKAIKKLSPKLAAIVWDKTNKPLASGLPFFTRYPALANHVGLARWGKAAEGMHDLTTLINAVPDTVIRKSLSLMDCLPTEVNEEAWQTIRAHLPTASFSAVWSQLDVKKMKHSHKAI